MSRLALSPSRSSMSMSSFMPGRAMAYGVTTNVKALSWTHPLAARATIKLLGSSGQNIRTLNLVQTFARRSSKPLINFQKVSNASVRILSIGPQGAEGTQSTFQTRSKSRQI